MSLERQLEQVWDDSRTPALHKILTFKEEQKYGARIFSARMALVGLDYFLNTGSMSVEQTHHAQVVLEQPKSKLFINRFHLEKFKEPVKNYHDWLEEKSSSEDQTWLDEFIDKRIAQVRLGWDAHDALVTNNFGLVGLAVRKIKSRGGFTYKDLEGYGMLGLIEAAAGYAFTANAKFSGYAFLRIKGAIVDARREYGTLMRVPRGLMSKISALLATYRADDGRALETLAGDKELLKEAADVQNAVNALNPVPIDIPADGADGDTLIHPGIIADPAGSAEDQAVARENMRELEDLIGRLKQGIASLRPRDTAFIRALYGIDTPKLTPLQLAQKYDLTRTRVYQLRHEILAELKLRLGNNGSG